MSPETKNQVANDLARHAAQEMERVLNRHMKTAMEILDPPDVAMMLVTIANGTAMGAALYSLQLSKDDKDPGEVMAMVGTTLRRLYEVGTPIVLERFAVVGRAEAA